MDINQIINKHFKTLKSLVKSSPVPIYNGFMDEDIFQSCILTAINKYHNEQVDENEGLEYLKRIILNETKFSYRKKKRDKLILVENIITYDREEEN